MKLALCFLLTTTVVGAEPEHSIVDMMPAISQLKSMVQWLAGDSDAAIQTQNHYINNGFGPSQLRSAYFLVTGETKKAGEIQLTFLDNMEPLVDGLPVIGHAKGVYHLLTNDPEKGWQALKSSTSSIGTVVGAVAGGPMGAIGGHVLADLVITGADGLIKGNDSRPHGLVEYVVNLNSLDAGSHFDAITGLATDAVGAKIGSPKSGKSNPVVSVARKTKSDVTAPDLEPLLGSFDRISAGMEENLAKTAPDSDLLKIVGSSPEIKMSLESESSSSVFKTMGNAWTDRVKQVQFKRFLEINKNYKNLNLRDTNTDILTPDKLYPFTQEHILKFLELNVLRNKLRYLSADHMSLIEKSDFRLINTQPNELKNCFGCAVGGILKKSVRLLHRSIPDLSSDIYSCNVGTYKVQFLDACKSAKLISDYKISKVYFDIREFDIMLHQEYNVLKDKHLILARGSTNTKVQGHAVVFKYKLASPNGLYPVKLLIDFQRQPMVGHSLPNPYRFQNFLNDQKYDLFQLISITLNK